MKRASAKRKELRTVKRSRERIRRNVWGKWASGASVAWGKRHVPPSILVFGYVFSNAWGSSAVLPEAPPLLPRSGWISGASGATGPRPQMGQNEQMGASGAGGTYRLLLPGQEQGRASGASGRHQLAVPVSMHAVTSSGTANAGQVGAD